MGGLYIHIPFCKTRCHYCDFYKTTDLTLVDELIEALEVEFQQRKKELEGIEFTTIYFGGGTPTILQTEQIQQLIDSLQQYYKVAPEAEITLECNPDDLSPAYLRQLKETSINRLSIGTQSFRDCDLVMMNRRHAGMQAINAVRYAQQFGYRNISIDLIYGLPKMSLTEWRQNILRAIDLDVPHISAYHLTYHEGTVFFERLKKNTLKEIPDELSLEQFKLLKKELEEKGYEHYEISNFAKEKAYSKHNRAYWERKAYLGFGPSAHSYTLTNRRWNVESVEQYIDALKNDEEFFEIEKLTEQDQYNDYIITSLRTQWGISRSYIQQNFDAEYLSHFAEQVQKFIDSNHVNEQEGNYTLTTEGYFLSDAIMEKLCYFN